MRFEQQRRVASCPNRTLHLDLHHGPITTELVARSLRTNYSGVSLYAVHRACDALLARVLEFLIDERSG